ncbi:MAG TPA: Lrp/AsnC family transcriptional regulator [Thermoleophilaceae bacterium]|jgi:DNA-binding Lrp family transcriptional regulator|nr:Lrp/AsnC family transcriptional regulator [Thermoleophilaceae bacterium]
MTEPSVHSRSAPAATRPAPGQGLDAVDAELVRELQRDGRATLQSLADRVRLSRTAVRARVQHLFDSGVVHVVGIMHAAVTGLQALAHVSVTVEGPVGPVADAIVASEAATFVSISAGEHALVVELRAGDDDALEAALDGVRSLPGITTVSAFRCATVVKDAYSVVRQREPIALDDVDWRLLEELQRNGRAPYTKLAALVGLSQAATRARVVRLIDSGTVHVTGLVDSSALGVREAVGLGIHVRGPARPLAERLAEIPGIHYVVTGFGRFDVICGLDAPSRTTLVETLERIRDDEGVASLNAWQHLAVVKETYAVDLTGRVRGATS